MKNYIPQDKHDHERARKAINLGYPAVAPILPDLLRWVQDMNWPVARTLQPFLARIGAPLEPHVRRILRSDDHMWQYWILLDIVAESLPLALKVRDEIIRLAERQPKDEGEEMVREAAQEVLQQLALDSE